MLQEGQFALLQATPLRKMASSASQGSIFKRKFASN
jgi:hypothetical protein